MLINLPYRYIHTIHYPTWMSYRRMTKCSSIHMTWIYSLPTELSWWLSVYGASHVSCMEITGSGPAQGSSFFSEI